MRQRSIGVLIASAVALAAPAALGQATTQTDQSEEDWRRSQKKSGSEVFDPNANTSSTGSGLNLPALEPIDQLPEDSRRHLRKMRARVIAEMGFGDEGERRYEPSEAAKTDPELAAQEEEVWEIILTDLEGSGAGSGAPGSGPNKVAVAGQGSGQDQSVMSGGSTQSAAEIMAQLKGLQTTGSAGNQGRPNAADQGAAGNADSIGDARTAETAGSSPSAGQSTEEAAGEDADPAEQAQDDAGASGESDGTSDGDGTEGNGSNGQGDGESEDMADGETGAGSGKAEEAGSSGTPDSRRAMPPMSPLSLPSRQDRDRGSTGASTSASDYLRQSGQTGDESDPKAESP